MLHIPPRQSRIGLEGQRHDGCGQWRRSRCPCVPVCAVVVQIRRDDLAFVVVAGRVGCCEGGGATLRIPGDVAVFRGRGHGQRIDGVDVAIAIAVVLFFAAVAGSPDENAACEQNTGRIRGSVEA